MATTIANAVADIKDRLILPAMPSGPQPSDAIIETLLRQSFKRLWGVIPPIFRSTFTVSPDQDVTTIDTDLANVLYVYGPRDMLIPTADFVETESGLAIRAYDFVKPGETIVVYFTTIPADLSTALEVESTCVFGPDWLEEAAYYWTEMQVSMRMGRTSDLGGSRTEGATFVTLERVFDTMIEHLRAPRNAWIVRMDSMLSVRQATVGMARQSPMQGFVNASRVENRATTTRTGRG